MPKHARTFTTLAAAGAMLAFPATGLGAKPANPGSQGNARSCAKVHTVSYQVRGTFLSATADGVTLKVTSANRHARNSGEITDQDAARRGVQVRGATYTVPASDAFTLKLNGFEAPNAPSTEDRVKVSGKVVLTKRRCAEAGTSTADRYATPDVKKVTISDREPAA